MKFSTHSLKFLLLTLLVIALIYLFQNKDVITRGWAQSNSGWRKIPNIVVMAPEHDSRLPATTEAIAFWNQTFAEIGTPFRLGAVTRIAETISADQLAALSQNVLRKSGSPQLPDNIQNLPGDLVIVLSDGEFISFAYGSAAQAKLLVAIKSQNSYPLTLPNVTRNVIAHELGHAMGLRHNSDPTKLMCGRPAPCRPNLFESTEAKFFPISEAEKAILLKMYPSTWKPR